MDQDATLYGGKPWPRRRCVRWGRSSPRLKGAQPPVFGSCLLWPNGWMDQDGTWHGGIGLGPVHIMLDGDRAPLPKRGQSHPPQFSAHLSSGQTAGWIKMALGLELGLGPGHIVLCGPSSLLQTGCRAPNFRSMSIVAKRLYASGYHLVRR